MTISRQITHVSTAAILAVAIGGCEVVDNKAASKQDTTASSRIVPDSAAGTVVPDSAAAAQVVPTDSATSATATPTPDDTGVVRLYPPEPRRGGVLFALAEGVSSASPRCSWKSAPIPCYTTGEGTLVTIPLPADDVAGTFTLTFERPNGKIVRQIAVADHEFPRELILLTDSLYKRATSSKEVARDARAVRGIASLESADRRWTGRWREPVTGMKSTGYGVERYYYRATDSTRSIQLDAQAKTRATFGGDTSDVAFSGAPSWRHAGLDLPARRGASVTAPASGVVIDVGDYILSGRTLLVDHGQGVVSAYFHLDTALVSKGDVVQRGDRIARVGSTGLATGPHLHYGLYLHGKDVDPVAFRDMPNWMTAAADSTSRK